MMKKWFVFAVAAIMVLFVTSSGAYAANKANWGDSVYIDSAGIIYAGSGISMGGVTKTTWGSVVSPWEEAAGVTSLTSDPLELFFTHSTNMLTTGGITVQNEDITLENGGKIENSTDNAIRFTENSDTLDFVFTANDVEFEISDGGLILDLNDATDGTFDVWTNNDNDDYIQFSTSANQPSINFVGCNGKITAASGTIDFDNEILTTTGTLSAGATTVTSLIIGDDTYDVVTDDEFRFASNDESSTIEAYGFEAKDAILLLTADESDDNGDEWQLVSNQSGNALTVENDASGAMVAHLTIAATTGNVTLIGDIVNENADTIKMNTDDTWQFVSNDEASMIEALGFEAKEGRLVLSADQDDDATDGWEIAASITGTLTIGNDSAVAGTFVDKLTIAGSDGDITTTGDVEIVDDMDLVFGTNADWKVQYDEGVDNQLLFITAGTAAIATTDPMFEILVGTTPTANQEVFGVSKGTQATNTALFTVDEDGDVVVTATLTAAAGDFGDGNIANVGDIACDSITSDAATVVKINDGLQGLVDEITATDAGVAASLTTVITEITTNGDSDLDNVTLANGVSGQIKMFVVVVEGAGADTVKITPATMLGGTQITFTGAVGGGCTMIYADSEGWAVIGQVDGTIA